MRKVLTYCKNIPDFMAEAASKLPQYIEEDDSGNAVGLLIDKSQLCRVGDESIAIVLWTADEAKAFAALKNITALANVAKDDPDILSELSKSGRAKYDRLYDQTPMDILDDSGNVVGTQAKPELFADFA